MLRLEREGIIFISVIAFLAFIFIYFVAIPANTKETYCGKVIKKVRIPAGYKVSEKLRVVFYSKRLKRNISVENVAPNSYYNITVGSEVCFGLTKSDIE